VEELVTLVGLVKLVELEELLTSAYENGIMTNNKAIIKNRDNTLLFPIKKRG